MCLKSQTVGAGTHDGPPKTVCAFWTFRRKTMFVAFGGVFFETKSPGRRGRRPLQ